MLEIEIKAYCDNHDNVIEKIISLGGRLSKTLRERDIYYNHPARNFKETDECLRIRIVDNKNILTYKGPKIDQNTKSRFEEEVEFVDLDSMIIILSKLGFVEVDEIIKDRDLYIINDIEVCIDKVEDLGSFVELEKRDMDRVTVEKELFELAKDLGLSQFERTSYLELKQKKNSDFY